MLNHTQIHFKAHAKKGQMNMIKERGERAVSYFTQVFRAGDLHFYMARNQKMWLGTHQIKCVLNAPRGKIGTVKWRSKQFKVFHWLCE